MGKKMENITSKRKKDAITKHNERPNVHVEGEQLPVATIRQSKRRRLSDNKLASKLQALGVEYDCKEVGPAAKPQKKKAVDSPKVVAAPASKRKRADPKPAIAKKKARTAR